MRFSTVVVGLAAALSATATPLSSRQSARILATFYPNTGCQEPSTGVSQFFDQVGPGECRNATIPVAYGSVFFQDNSIHRSIRFFNKPCGQEGSANFFEIGEGTADIPGCRTQQILSFETI